MAPRHEDLLRSALSAKSTGRAITSEQRAIITQICSAPEKASFAPEDFLIAFKLALVNAANEVGIPPGPERNELLARMVSVCIEEFFRLPPLGDGSSAIRSQEVSQGSR